MLRGLSPEGGEMKKFSVVTVLLVAGFLLIYLPIAAQLTKDIQKVDSASLEAKVKQLERKIEQMEKELREYQQAIRVKGPNVEIQAAAVLQLKGAIIKFNQGTSPIITNKTVIMVPTPFGTFRAVINNPSPNILAE